MKTLEQYKQKFEVINDESLDELLEFETLAYQCISNYPNEKFGYEQLGVILYFLFWETDYRENSKSYIKYLNNAKKDLRFITTSEQIIVTAFDLADVSILDLVYKEEKPEYSVLYTLCSKLESYFQDFSKASEYLEIATRLGYKFNKENLKLINPEIDKIEIEDYFCLKKLKISFNNQDKIKKEIYFLGENGVGKTLLLQSIIQVMKQGNKNNLIYSNIDNYFDNDNLIKSYQNIFAYGVSRFRVGNPEDDFFDTKGYETLFDRNKLLINIEFWLKDLQRKNYIGNSKIAWKTITEMLESILNTEKDSNIKIEFNESKDRFLFIENGSETEFKHLAEGYRSLLIWLCDLLRRLIENQPYITDLKQFYGIVLIDEIDMFLHPKWKTKIVGKLREKLPNIQWFFTTHSPMLVLGASKDAVFYKLYKQNGETKISEQWTTADFIHLLANGIITSPLFDLENAQMSLSKKNQVNIDSSQTFWQSEFNRIIMQQINEEKNKGKVYFSKIDVNNLVKNVIDKIDKTEKK